MHGEGLNEGLDLMHINLDDHGTKRAACNWRSYNNNNNLNIFMQDCCFSFKKKTAINAGPVKN